MNRTQLSAFAVALTVALALALALGARSRPETPVRVANVVQPASVAPTASVRPLALAFEAPAMLPDQAYWYRQAQVVSLRPDVSPTARTLWMALLWTETGFQPWAESEVGAYGLGQLYGALRTPETDADPVANLNVSLSEWLRLVEEYGGDYSAAIAAYKGVTSEDQRWQAETVWQLVRVHG